MSNPRDVVTKKLEARGHEVTCPDPHGPLYATKDGRTRYVWARGKSANGDGACAMWTRDDDRDALEHDFDHRWKSGDLFVGVADPEGESPRFYVMYTDTAYAAVVLALHNWWRQSKTRRYRDGQGLLLEADVPDCRDAWARYGL